MNTDLFFDFYYNNAEINSIIIMDSVGTVLDVNQAFTNNFGYDKEEIKGKNFDTLFIPKDKENNKPQNELETVLLKGQCNDENYIVNRNGHAVWCMGESILVAGKEGEKYIVKDIINLQAKKQLQLFLKDTDELLKRIFNSSKDIPMMIIDSSMKIQKVNTAFLQLFEIDKTPPAGSRLSDLDHSFWNSDDIKNEVRKILVDNKPLLNKKFLITDKSGVQKQIKVDSKIIDNPTDEGRQIFIIFDDIITNEAEQ